MRKLWLGLSFAVLVVSGSYYWLRPTYFLLQRDSTIKPAYEVLAADGKLQPFSNWKFGDVIDVQANETLWFLPVENHLFPVKLNGVDYFPVHPTYDNDPRHGFDEKKVFLVITRDVLLKRSLD